MIKINGETRVEVKATIEDAIEAMYQDCIAKGKSETDKTDERSAKIFESIDCLRRNYVAITNSTKNEKLNKIMIEGIQSNYTDSTGNHSVLYVDSIKILKELIAKINRLSERKTIDGVTFICCDPCLKSVDIEYANKVDEVRAALAYLSRNYSYYINGISLEDQREDEEAKDLSAQINRSDFRSNISFNRQSYAESLSSLHSERKQKFSLFNRKNNGDESKKEEEKKIVNYWEFLNIPKNSSLKRIKVAYIEKFDLIEKSLAREENIYSQDSLVVLNNAFATLCNPYLRYVHNCEINGVETKSIEDFTANVASELEEDFRAKANGKILEYISGKIRNYSYLRDNSNLRDSAYGIKFNDVVLMKLIEILKHNYEELSKKIEEQNAVKHVL